MAAHDDERAVLVHGDVHEWNALQAPGGGLRLVDPDGLVAEPEYDLGVMMREDPVELMHGDPATGRGGSPAGPASTRRRSGSGAPSSGSQPGSWLPGSGSRPSAGRC
jgi:aminoglycoside phosphotransferase (APT) family kinase protein